MMGLDINRRQRRAFLCDLMRASASGVVEAFAGGIFLLVAITRLEASKAEQALIATGGSWGLLLGPLVVSCVRNVGCRVQHAMAALHFLGALGLVAAALAQNSWLYCLGGVVALAAGGMAVPLATQYYQQNYLEEVRGKLFAVASTLRLGVAAIFAWAMGESLARNFTTWSVMPAACALAMGLAGAILWLSPGDRLDKSAAAAKNHFELSFAGSLKYLWQDSKFAWLIAVWMMMGFGNLMMVPLRVKYVVEDQFGIGLNEAEAAFLVGVVPGVVFFLTTWWMGRLFDAMNFFVLRSVLNTLFLLSIIVYFSSTSMPGLLLGSALLGLAFSGGNVAWSLWVTKIAPADRVADYMSVHTFMTGLRGLLAPALGVWLTTSWNMTQIVWLSSILIALSTLMLGPELRTLWRRRAGQPVNNQIAE